ncbi:ABC transporter permease [Parasphingopyxis lamellibrachiae]|uniref:ABC-2 type transport system permease protein n=1 Tax=Parasphingopyxis lamellibrachiae TaxID=680125 RepID=A0A3D9FFK9_9SPHN|nr:ABC transporter permease [Parasphingopyxis lamellibrachiae]RED16615.1 ABC-2 type transport system permease protein [Parasphingopyxis lamellibrachiae]
MSNHLHQAAVIARRDFIATVATPAFLMFLLAPLFMLIFAMVGGTGARMIADSGDDAQRLVVIADADYGTYIEAADERIRATFPLGIAPAELERREPQGGDPEQQARALFTESSIDVSAVLFGFPDTPRIIYGSGARGADYLALLADTAARDRQGGTPPGETVVEIERESYARTSATIGGQQSLGFAALFLLFLLTLLLAGQTVSVLAEEKGNKVIEILAAAVPLEAVFLGKLVGLFGVALLFVAFWGTLAVLAVMALPGSGAALTMLDPAIGFVPFLALAIAYFAMGYLLLGSVFLAVGGQASSMREIQMLSLPITFFQMAMFGLASAAAARPGSSLALFAELFPFSSPFAMVAKGASDPRLWPHLAAIAWQLLWVSITISLGARWFRKGVLKSGPSVFARIGALFRGKLA